MVLIIKLFKFILQRSPIKKKGGLKDTNRECDSKAPFGLLLNYFQNKLLEPYAHIVTWCSKATFLKGFVGWDFRFS